MAKYTRDSMRDFLRTAKTGTLERGILSIFALQTNDEQNVKHTKHKNDRGFSKKTDKIGTKMAEYLLTGRHMVNKDYVEHARRVCMEHARQLAEIANGGELKKIRDQQFTAWNIKGI